MAKVKVLMQQYVEQIAEIEIEVADPEDRTELAKAYDLALTNADQIEWKEGDDAYKVEVYAIMNAAGEMVWER